MGKFARLMRGLWVVMVSVTLLSLVETLFPEFAVEYAYLLGLFFLVSVLTTTSIWLND